MADKRFKLKFSGVVNSLKLCRSKDILDSPQPSQPAAIYRRKPTGAVRFPAPPHSTPERRRGIIGQVADYRRKRGSKSKGRVQKVPSLKLFPTSTSFSDDSSLEFARVDIKSGRGRGGLKGELNLKVVGPGTEIRSGAAARVVPLAEGKVRGSVAVATKSEDPREDFRRSMVEMIVEKDLFEAEDLEQLLQCFLTLNHEAYHRAILEAFIDVWEELFSST